MAVDQIGGVFPWLVILVFESDDHIYYFSMEQLIYKSTISTWSTLLFTTWCWPMSTIRKFITSTSPHGARKALHTEWRIWWVSTTYANTCSIDDIQSSNVFTNLQSAFNTDGETILLVIYLDFYPCVRFDLTHNMFYPSRSLGTFFLLLLLFILLIPSWRYRYCWS